MDPERRQEVAAALQVRTETVLRDVERTYGPAPRRDPLSYSKHHYPNRFPRSVEEQLDRFAGIAGALVTDADGRVLCVDVGYNDVDWQTPGGAVEGEDSLPETARREVYEETGIEAELTGLLYTRRVEYEYPGDDPATLPMAVFTGRRVAGEVRVPDRTVPDGRDEIADVRWFAPQDLPEGTLDRERIVEHCRE